MIFTYERISTIRQDVRRQEIAFEGLKIDRKYIDKLSGKDKDRPQLNKLMLEAKKGDTIYVESVSRLGRNVDDLRYLVDFFIEKGVTINFIKEGFTTKGNSYKFMLTILGAVAEMERDLTLDRIAMGVEKAKLYGTKSGKPFGRPNREEFPKDFEKYYKKWKDGDITGLEFAKLIEVSKSTLYRYIKLKEGK